MLGVEGNSWNLQAPLSFALTFVLPVLFLGLAATLTIAAHGILPLDLPLIGSAFLSPLVQLTVGAYEIGSTTHAASWPWYTLTHMSCVWSGHFLPLW